MYGISALFLCDFPTIDSNRTSKEYVAGAVILGAAPCTAMVFVWSYLTKVTLPILLVQVAINDLIILVLFAPIVAFLLGVDNVSVPLATLLLSTVLL